MAQYRQQGTRQHLHLWYDEWSAVPVMGEFDEYPEIGDEVTVYGTVTESPSSGWLIIDADYFKLACKKNF